MSLRHEIGEMAEDAPALLGMIILLVIVTLPITIPILGPCWLIGKCVGRFVRSTWEKP